MSETTATQLPSKTSNRGKCKMFYNYLVLHEGNEYRFKMTSEITEKFKIPNNTIFHIINRKNKKKWTDFVIKKIKEPVYALREVHYLPFV